jgi:aldehyde:ferredoxin oxidoreductase
MLEEYYAIRGWDVKTGLQKRKTLEDLKLADMIPGMQKLGLVAE